MASRSRRATLVHHVLTCAGEMIPTVTTPLTKSMVLHLPASGGAVATSGPSPAFLAGEHFTAALFYFVCGAFGLVWIAPDLANGVFYLPYVVAIVHLFTLGWIVLSIFGALCQFLPVAVGQSLRFPTVAHVSFGAQSG